MRILIQGRDLAHVTVSHRMRLPPSPRKTNSPYHEFCCMVRSGGVAVCCVGGEPVLKCLGCISASRVEGWLGVSALQQRGFAIFNRSLHLLIFKLMPTRRHAGRNGQPLEFPGFGFSQLLEGGCNG